VDIASVNWLAVVVCVVINMVAGFVWYHPKVFYNAWWRGLGNSEDEQTDPSPVLYLFTIIAAFVEGVIVSMVLSAIGATSIGSGLLAGFLIWLGFVATTHLVNNLFAGRPWKVWAIEVGNHLVYLLICGAILSVWR
jgi:hypothetical protein